MTRKSARTTGRGTAAASLPRKLLLAGLGGIVVARRQGAALVEAGRAEAETLMARGQKLRTQVEKDAGRWARQARAQVEAVAAPIRERVETVVGSVQSEVGDRLGGVLGRLGVPARADLEDLIARLSNLNRKAQAAAPRRAKAPRKAVIARKAPAARRKQTAARGRRAG